MDVKSTLIVSLALFAVLFVPPLAANSTDSNTMPTLQAITAAIKEVAFNPTPAVPVKNKLPDR